MRKYQDVYIFLYNVVQGIGWAGVLVSTGMALSQGAPLQAAFLIGAGPAWILQFAAALEIVHAAAGIVKSNPVSNFWQWLGRANALIVFAVQIPELQTQIWAVTMLLVWALGETIRYPWYAATLLEDCPDWLTWLRYTAFIPLYPLGVVAEMVLLYKGLPYVRERSIMSVSMPNTWNFAWDHALFVQIMLFAYPYLWWQNYSSLLRQRKRKIATLFSAPAAAPGVHRATKQE